MNHIITTFKAWKKLMFPSHVGCDGFAHSYFWECCQSTPWLVSHLEDADFNPEYEDYDG